MNLNGSKLTTANVITPTSTKQDSQGNHGKRAQKGSNVKYHVFTRYWWRVNSDGSRTPEMGTKQHKAYFDTVQEARAYCIEWNRTHTPGKSSIKAEFESC